MSFYWRWVVVRTAVAAGTGAIDTLATLAVSRTYGPDELLWLSMSVTTLLAFPVILAEHYVLASRFPSLSRMLFVTMSLLPIVVFTACITAIDESTALEALTNEAAIDEADVNIGSLLIVLGLGLLALISIPGIILLPWVAIGQVARGFLVWAVAIVLAAAASIGLDYAVVSLRGLEWPEPSSTTWIGAVWTFATLIAAELVYALISGNGVARLRPLPEATP